MPPAVGQALNIEGRWVVYRCPYTAKAAPFLLFTHHGVESLWLSLRVQIRSVDG